MTKGYKPTIIDYLQEFDEVPEELIDDLLDLEIDGYETKRIENEYFTGITGNPKERGVP